MLHPAIHLEKTVSKALVPAGSKVTYTFLATNVGRARSRPTTSSTTPPCATSAKPANPVCRKPRLVAKEGGNQDNFLDRVPAETWTVHLQGHDHQAHRRPGGGRRPGWQHRQRKIPVSHFATAQVTPFHPGIEVEKSASPTT